MVLVVEERLSTASGIIQAAVVGMGELRNDDVDPQVTQRVSSGTWNLSTTNNSQTHLHVSVGF